jgi:hypothetical protein
MIEESNDIFKRTQDDLGIEYCSRVTQLCGHSVPQMLSTVNASGNDIIERMLAHVKTLPKVGLMLDSAFQSFVLGSDGQKCKRDSREEPTRPRAA